MLRFFITIFLSTALVLTVKGQKSVGEKTGFWTTGSTWQGGIVPGTLSSGTITLNNLNITIQGTVQSMNNLTLNGGKITVASADTLIIVGDLILNSGSVIDDQGYLIVYGNVINTDSNLTAHPTGYLVVTGNYTSTAKGVNDFQGGTSYVFGNTTGTTKTPLKEADLNKNVLELYNYVKGMQKALPIELAYFQATLQHDQVELKWKTFTEINNEYFIVERSSDGTHFYEVERVTGAGNSKDRREYIIFDRNPIHGRSYYKLSQVDFDGKKTGFKVVTVLYGGEISRQPYPNPTTGLLYFSCSGCNYSVTLKDANSFRLDGIQVTETEKGKFGIDLTQLDRGIYFVTVSVSDTGPPSTLRIVKK